VKEHHKENTEPGREDVRDKHGAVVETRLGEEIFITDITTLLHIKRPLETERSSIEHIPLVTTGAFMVEDTVRFLPFFENPHMVFVLLEQR
jgi:hypothetical protein